jgi:hypothetical protein
MVLTWADFWDRKKPQPKRKTAYLQGLSDAGGGTRTPDTRIMIPLL